MKTYIALEKTAALFALKLLPREDFALLMEKIITGEDIPLSDNAEFCFKQMSDFAKDKEDAYDRRIANLKQYRQKNNKSSEFPKDKEDAYDKRISNLRQYQQKNNDSPEFPIECYKNGIKYD